MTAYVKPEVFRLGEAVLLIAGGPYGSDQNELDFNGTVKLFHQNS